MQEIMKGLPSVSSLTSRVEMVTAEVLNNITEHSFTLNQKGLIRVEIWKARLQLFIRVRDRGLPLPGKMVPKGTLPSLKVSADQLPEGGFGWFLIHDQCDSVFYSHRNGENLLQLMFFLSGQSRKVQIS